MMLKKTQSLGTYGKCQGEKAWILTDCPYVTQHIRYEVYNVCSLLEHRNEFLKKCLPTGG